MISNILFHWCLDMAGAASLWCIIKGCNNPAHHHNRFVRTAARFPWVLQSLFAIPIAYTTVLIVG